MDKEFINEKLETIDYLLSHNEYKDLESLKSILNDLIELNYLFMEEFLKKAKENNQIKLIPRTLENKKQIYINILKEKYKLNSSDIKKIITLIELKNSKLLQEKFSDYNSVRDFYNLIQKLYSVLF